MKEQQTLIKNADTKNLSEKDNPECSITKICVPDILEMPMIGIVLNGRINGSRGSNTPGFGYLTPGNGTDLYGLGNGSTPFPGFYNPTANTGTDLDGSGGQEWIQIIIPNGILFVVFLPLILIGSVRWWRRRRFVMRNGNLPAVQFQPV